MKKFVIRDISLATLLALGALPVWAQQSQAPGVNPGTLLRNIESLQVPAKPADKPAATEQSDDADLKPLVKLARVDVRGFDTLAPAFKLYWQDAIGKPVSAEDLAKFKI